MQSSNKFNKLFFHINKHLIELIKEAINNSDQIALQQLHIDQEQAKYIASLDESQVDQLSELGGLLVNININNDILNIAKDSLIK